MALILFIVAGLIAIIGVAGGGAYTPPASSTPIPPAQVIFTGHVYYSDGTPVGGAEVHFEYPTGSPGPVITTGADGAYTYATYFNGKQAKVWAVKNTISSPATDISLYNTGNTETYTNDLTIPTRPTVNFQGHVTYGGTGVPATLTITYGGVSPEVAADGTGYYDWGVFYAGGSATIKASYEGHDSAEYTVTPGVDSIVTTNIDIPTGPTPRPQAHFVGHVTHDGLPVAGASVHIYYGGSTGETTTDGGGYYDVMSWYSEVHATISVTYPGLHVPERMMDVTPGGTITTDFTMTDAVASGTPSPTAGTTTPSPTVTPEPSVPGNATPTALPSASAPGNATASPAPTGQSQSPNGTGNTTLTASLSASPTAGISPTAVSPAGGISVTYLVLGIGVIVLVLAAAAFLVLRKKS